MNERLAPYLPPLNESGRRWLRFGAVVASFLLLVWTSMSISGVLTPIAAALAIAYVLNPVVNWMEQHQVRRVTSVSVGLILVLGLTGVLLFICTLQIFEFSQQVPRYAREIIAWLNTTFPGLIQPREAVAIADELDSASQPASAPATGSGLLAMLSGENFSDLARRQGVSLAHAAWIALPDMVARFAYWITCIVLVPMYAFYFLVHFNEIVATVRMHLPTDYRETIVRVVGTIDRSVADFFRGRLLIAVLVGVISGVGWLIVGTPYSLALGAISIPLQLIPFMGVLVLPPAMILAYLEAPPEGWMWPVILAFAVFMIAQIIESFILAPYVYAQSSGLHPVTTIIALMVGAELAGVLGMLLSIPLASTMKSLGIEYLLPEIRRIAGRGDSAPGAAATPYNLEPGRTRGPEPLEPRE